MAFERDRPTLVCGRRGDPYLEPAPGSAPGWCEVCGHEVVVAPRSGLRHAAEGLSIVCLECFARYRDAGHPVVVVRHAP